MITRFIFTLCFFSTFTICSQNNDMQVADSLAAVGKHQEAISLLDSLEPKSDKVYLKLAKLQQQAGQNDEALQYYKKVLEQSPDRVLTSLDYGELLLESGKLEEADSLFSDLSEKYPDNAGFLYRIGLAKEKKKDSTAMKYFYKTISKDFTHQGALYKTAKDHLKNGKSYNAITLCKMGLKERPNNASLLSILGQAYSVSLQFEKAIAPYEKLVELGEGSEFVLEKLAKAYKVTSQPQKAIETYKKMLDINNANSAVHSNLGALYLNMDETEKARQHFTMALAIKDQPVDNEYLYLGLAYKKDQEFRSSYISFQKALEENPENERAFIELALAADAHFNDKEAVLELYQNFVSKYAEHGRKDMLSIAEYRISELKKEIHLSK